MKLEELNKKGEGMEIELSLKKMFENIEVDSVIKSYYVQTIGKEVAKTYEVYVIDSGRQKEIFKLVPLFERYYTLELKVKSNRILEKLCSCEILSDLIVYVQYPKGMLKELDLDLAKKLSDNKWINFDVLKRIQFRFT